MSKEPIICPKCRSQLTLKETSIKRNNITEVKVQVVCPNCGFIPLVKEGIREPPQSRTNVFTSELLRPITFHCPTKNCGVIELITKLPWTCPRCKGTLTFIPANTMRTSEKKSK